MYTKVIWVRIDIQIIDDYPISERDLHRPIFGQFICPV